ncbi:LuxR C-terminal-related transcriptional regulator [Pseudomonas vancouverensis]|uniref:LuxR C-terminal-related transcriptional regulator n=1 Tax=Pseudomonas vancouverensis TaxID=95300 RepID=UPI003D0834C1
MSLAITHKKPHTPPHCGQVIVPRPRLRQALLDAPWQVRLLCAPAGSGKTFLLRECAQHCPADTRLLWFDLKGQSIETDGFIEVLARQLGVSHDMAGVQTCLERQTTPLWLMIDDYPRAADDELDSVLNSLLLSTSHQVHWWIASRRRPNCQLMRLLLERKLLELGTRELALTHSELEELLKRESPQLAPCATQKMMDSTGGWYAGVRMQLLGQRRGVMPVSPQNSLLIERYLEGEVLNGLAPQWCEWLCTLACLPGFDAELCDHLIGTFGGGRLMRQMHETGLFVDTMDCGVARYSVQPAVAGLLSARLSLEQKNALFIRACQWCIATKQEHQAIEYALLAGQEDVAVSVLQRFNLERLLQGQELARVLHWCEQLSVQSLSESLELVTLVAWAQLLGGRLAQAQRWANRLQHFMPQPDANRQRALLAQWQVLTATIACHRAETPSQEQALEHAVECLAQDAWAQSLLGQATLIELALSEGKLELARQRIRSALAMARRHASLAIEGIVLLHYVDLLEIRGELKRADTLLDRMYFELKTVSTTDADLLGARIRIRHAGVLVHLGRYTEATRFFQSGLEQSLACQDPMVIRGYLGLADMAATKNELEQAFFHLGNASRLLQCQQVAQPLYEGQLTLAYTRLWLCQGQHAKAERALAQCLALYQGRTVLGHPQVLPRLALQLAQVQMAAGHNVVVDLEDMRLKAQAQGRWPLVCKLWLCLAQAFDFNGQRSLAGHALMEGLKLSRRLGLSGIERSFKMQGHGLMVIDQASKISVSDVRLSRRELIVLEMIAQGLSNREIAEGLHLSLHTIKSHAQKINAKLGVSSRSQAIAQAKLLGMIA